MLVAARCHSLITHEACNCYMPPPVLPTSGWVWSWRACYFLSVARSQRSFREDQRDTCRQKPILPRLAEEPDFDLPLTQHKRSSGKRAGWGLPLKFSLGSERVRWHARLCTVIHHAIVVSELIRASFGVSLSHGEWGCINGTACV